MDPVAFVASKLPPTVNAKPVGGSEARDRVQSTRENRRSVAAQVGVSDLFIDQQFLAGP